MTGNTFNTLVFDIGGSHATASLIRDEAFQLHCISNCALRQGASKEALLDALEHLGRNVLAQAGVSSADLSGVGFAMPGPFDYEAGISKMQHKHASLFGVSIRNEIAYRLGAAPGSVTFINDAAAFLLGEVAAGAATGAHRVIGITLGTGVGSGFAVDGEIVTSGPGVPPGGEIWNVKWGSGIFEDVISTRAIQRIYYSLTGKTSEVREIAARVQHDSAAAETFRRFGRDFGAVLNSLSEQFHPDLVVIGGAISRSANLFLPLTTEALKERAVRIVVSKLFEDAALVGAGVNWVRLAKVKAS